jgi:hypothetical protein
MATYSVTYNGNSSPTSEPSFFNSATYPASFTYYDDTIISYVGKTLSEWNTKRDGTGTSYSMGQIINAGTGVGQWNATTEITVYAIWTTSTYSVTYYKNDGITPEATLFNSVTYPEEFIYYGNTNSFTRTGYTISNWNTKRDGTGGSYSTGRYVGPGNFPGQWNVTTTITVYAIWYPTRTQLSYTLNSGTITSINHTPVGNVTLGATCRTPTATRSGYTFNNWKSSIAATDGNIKTISANTQYTWNFAANCALIANWNPNKYTIQYNNNGGSGTITSNVVTFGTTSSIISISQPNNLSFFENTSNMILWLKFQNNLTDSSTNNKLVSANNISFDSTNFKTDTHCVKFGSNSYINCAVNVSGTFTVCCWINLVESTSYIELFHHRSSSGGWGIGIRNNNTLEILTRNTNGTLSGIYEPLYSNIAGTGWHHIALVIIKSSSNIKLYVDGVLISSITRSYNDDIASTLRIGASSSIPIVNYIKENSLMDDFRMYNVELSAGNIRDLYNAIKAPTGKVFVNWSTDSNANTGTYYSPGFQYDTSNFGILTTSSQTLALYAKWGHIITYSHNPVNGGTGNPYTVNTESPIISFPPNTQFSKTGYTSSGWNSNVDAPSVLSTPYSFSNNDIILYAIWNTPKTYTINYELNGIRYVTKPSNGTATYNSPFTASKLLLSGYSVAWNILPNGTGRSFPSNGNNGGTWDIDSASSNSLYAIRSDNYNGKIMSIIIDNGGYNYSISTTITVDAPSTGIDGATVSPIISLDDGKITGINIVNAGSGYTVVPKLTLNNIGSGSGALFTVIIGNSRTLGLSDLKNRFEDTGANSLLSYYNNAGKASGIPDIPPLPRLTATVSLDRISSVIINDPSHSYMVDYVPSITISSATGSGASLQAVLGVGEVSYVNIINGGSGYINPVLSVSLPSTGSTVAQFSAIVTNGKITGVTISNGGSGYTTAPTITISDTTGSGAELVTYINGLKSVNIINGGSGYTTPPTLTVKGPPLSLTAFKGF